MRPPCSSSRSISARASVDLPLPDRPVKKSTRPCSSGSGWSTRRWRRSRRGGPRLARRGGVRQGVDRVTAGVGLDHLGAEGVVGVGVTVGGERDRHDGRVVEQVGGHQRGAHQRDRGQDEVPVPIRARSTTRPSPRSSSRSASVSASTTGTKAAPRSCSRAWAGVRCSRRKGPYCACVSDSSEPSAATRASGRPSGSTSSASVAPSGSSRVTTLPSSLNRESGA